MKLTKSDSGIKATPFRYRVIDEAGNIIKSFTSKFHFVAVDMYNDKTMYTIRTAEDLKKTTYYMTAEQYAERVALLEN